MVTPKTERARQLLANNPPKIARCRARFRGPLGLQIVRGDMVLAVDHIWRLTYRGCPRILRKRPRDIGKQRSRIQLPRQRRIAKQVRAAMREDDGDLTDISVDGDTITCAQKRARTRGRMMEDNEVSRVGIKDERFGYTNVTSWWGNGDAGPLIYIIPENRFKASKVRELNQRFQGEAWILTSGKDNNHFADGENNIQMWEEACEHVARVAHS